MLSAHASRLQARTAVRSAMVAAIDAAGVKLASSDGDAEKSAEEPADGVAVGVVLASGDDLGAGVRAVFDSMLAWRVGASASLSSDPASVASAPRRAARRGPSQSPIRRARNRFRDAWQWGSLREA